MKSALNKLVFMCGGGFEMEDFSCNNECNSVAKCDIFDFMAKHVGMTVIRPGGFEATNKLLKSLNITSNSKVIDIDEKLIEDAKYLTKKKGLENKIDIL